MDSDKCRHRESEFYFPKEETLNQTKSINRGEVEQDRYLINIQEKNMLFNGLGRSVWEKSCALGLEYILKTSGTVFSHTDLPPGK